MALPAALRLVLFRIVGGEVRADLLPVIAAIDRAQHYLGPCVQRFRIVRREHQRSDPVEAQRRLPLRACGRDAVALPRLLIVSGVAAELLSVVDPAAVASGPPGCTCRRRSLPSPSPRFPRCRSIRCSALSNSRDPAVPQIIIAARGGDRLRGVQSAAEPDGHDRRVAGLLFRVPGAGDRQCPVARGHRLSPGNGSAGREATSGRRSTIGSPPPA